MITDYILPTDMLRELLQRRSQDLKLRAFRAGIENTPGHWVPGNGAVFFSESNDFDNIPSLCSRVQYRTDQ